MFYTDTQPAGLIIKGTTEINHEISIPPTGSAHWPPLLVKTTTNSLIVQELWESRGGRPGWSVLTSFLVSVDVKIYWTMLTHWSQLVPNMSTTSEDIKHDRVRHSELRSGVKVEVAVLGSPSLISLMVSVDVKEHWTEHCSTQSPDEIKRREVRWTLTKKLDFHLRVQARSRRGGW